MDWNEYKFSDKENPAIGKPRGEICIGGPTVAMGYLVDPENPDPDVVAKNTEEFIEEGGIRWFRTGDIGAGKHLPCPHLSLGACVSVSVWHQERKHARKGKRAK